MHALLAGLGDDAGRYPAVLGSLGVESTIVAEERASLTIDLAPYDLVVCNSLFEHNDISRFTALKYVQLTSAGLDRVPLDYIRDHGIALHSARGVYSVPMAEWILAGLLSLYKDLRRFSRQQEGHVWLKNRDLTELAGRSVCIVGAGSVGQEVAKRLRAFDTAVTGVDLRTSAGEHFEAVISIDELDSVLPMADIVVLTLPLNISTARLFDAERVARMKPGSVLVNVSRGGLVDQAALCDALSAGHLGGAVLDVFETEPLPEESPLWEMQNVVITPHNSFVSERNRDRLFELILENLTDYLARETENM